MRVVLPIVAFLGSPIGGALSLVVIGIVACSPAVPPLDGLVPLVIFGALFGTLCGVFAALPVAIFMRPVQPGDVHLLWALLVGLCVGAVGAPSSVWLWYALVRR
jgi:hypothetical protein